MSLRASSALLSLLLGLAGAGSARADGTADRADVSGRLSMGTLLQAESSDAPALAAPLMTRGELRARIEARRLAAGRLDALADMRVHLASYGTGGDDEQRLEVREADAHVHAGSVAIGVGRYRLAELDALAVDGMRLTTRRAGIEGGLFAGLLPDPLSRSLEDDYRASGGFALVPLGTGGWARYRRGTYDGSVGMALLAPRDPDPAVSPVEGILSSSSVWQVAADVGLHLRFAGALGGRFGAEVRDLELGALVRPTPRLSMQVSYARMSSTAFARYVASLLEAPWPLTGAPAQNNLALLRMGASEGRATADFSLPSAKLGFRGELRYRRRETFDDESLPDELRALPPEQQIDAGGSVRRRDAFLGVNLGASAVTIRGTRTGATFVTLDAHRSLLGERLDIEAAIVGSWVEDRCASSTDPTCTGATTGRGLRVRTAVGGRVGRAWRIYASVEVGRYTGGPAAGTAQPIDSLSAFGFVVRQL